jgi:transposase
MLNSLHSSNVYLALGETDMRKSIDGLALIVQESFRLDPFSRSLFVFCNRRKDKLKILYWEDSGFWLYYKRLEKGTFRWPAQSSGNKAVGISERELRWLLDGLELEQTSAHKPVKERGII